MGQSAVFSGQRHGLPGMRAADVIRHHAATGLLAGHLGLGGWLRLDPALARHWAAVDRAAQVCQGQVGAQATSVGRVVAAFARLLGSPFGPVGGNGIPVSVRVWLGADGRCLHWRRSYAIPGRLAEVFPGGLGVTLRLQERDGGLAFTSTGFVWRIFGRYLKIPHRLGPGRLTVVERCDADGMHDLALTVVHPWLGEIYRLDGRYRVQADEPFDCGAGDRIPADQASNTNATASSCPHISVNSESPDR